MKILCPNAKRRYYRKLIKLYGSIFSVITVLCLIGWFFGAHAVFGTICITMGTGLLGFIFWSMFSDIHHNLARSAVVEQQTLEARRKDLEKELAEISRLERMEDWREGAR